MADKKYTLRVTVDLTLEVAFDPSDYASYDELVESSVPELVDQVQAEAAACDPTDQTIDVYEGDLCDGGDPVDISELWLA